MYGADAMPNGAAVENPDTLALMQAINALTEELRTANLIAYSQALGSGRNARALAESNGRML